MSLTKARFVLKEHAWGSINKNDDIDMGNIRRKRARVVKDVMRVEREKLREGKRRGTWEE